MTYRFGFKDDFGCRHDVSFEAKKLNDALYLFALHVFKNKLTVCGLSDYYIVYNGSKEFRRIFSVRLHNKFFAYFRLISSFEREYGIEE